MLRIDSQACHVCQAATIGAHTYIYIYIYLFIYLYVYIEREILQELLLCGERSYTKCKYIAYRASLSQDVVIDAAFAY